MTSSVPGRPAPSVPLIEQALAPFVRFSQVEASGGIVLIACTVAALLWANSPYAPAYFALWDSHVTVGFGDMVLSKTLLHWINDGLMAVFFFMVGLEIKREVLVGELNSPRQAALPVAAAIGGMAVPAAIYAALNTGQASLAGWGIPMATDIAFALGILSLLGNRVPASLKVFLAAVAIVDDIGAVLVIAVFYSGDLSLFALVVGGAMFVAMLTANVMGVRHSGVYLILGTVLWLAFLKSGVHATIAGVVAAMAIPARTRIDGETFAAKARRLLGCFERAGGNGEPLLANKAQMAALDAIEEACRKAGAPLPRIEHALHPVVAYGIMPVFALANAGVALSGEAARSLGEPVSLGIILGLVLGKQCGIFAACLGMFKLGLTAPQAGARLGHYYGVACLAGIGFTMSIFIAGLAFGDQGALDATAKLAVLVASTISGLLGYLVLRSQGGSDEAAEAACAAEAAGPEAACPGVSGPCRDAS
ncbi:MAG: Na+/H+ antiporter NhaA [Solidesulfovibrio sp. DCME]|uniref:Na+/H+ antiporter NhaA n=1 Tax=Solidesulfovibrio sp. DCME TaxID=3447380 RepID=UPI003D09652A